MSAGYRFLPLVYDRWQNSYGKDFSTLILPRLLSTLRSQRINGRSMVDVACGTGTLALMMARRGWHVYGVDASDGMIAQAVAKLAGTSSAVTFLNQDMRQIALPERVDLATSFFDSINHLLTAEDLSSAFRSVRDALREGGWFIFDVNNERCFTTLWKQTESVRHAEFTLVLDNAYDRAQRLASSDVTLVVQKGRHQERFTERVQERYYPHEEISTLLEASGFMVRVCEDFNFTANAAVGKIKTWWVAQADL